MEGGRASCYPVLSEISTGLDIGPISDESQENKPAISAEGLFSPREFSTGEYNSGTTISLNTISTVFIYYRSVVVSL